MKQNDIIKTIYDFFIFLSIIVIKYIWGVINPAIIY